MTILPSGTQGDAAEVKYTSLPADDYAELAYPLRAEDDTKINAADLFSLFTANIIKEERIFIR